MAATYEESQIRLLVNPVDEKWAAEQNELINSVDDRRQHSNVHGCTRSNRGNIWAKAAFASLLATLLTLTSLLALSLLCPEVHSLFKRQSSGSTTGNNQSAFTNQKLWIIIVVVVGTSPLFIVIDDRSDYRLDPWYHGFGLVLSRCFS